MKTRSLPRCLAALAILLCATPALADYLCESKERDMPAAQKEMFLRATAAMRAALLPPPEGWLMNKPGSRRPGDKLCADFKNDPITFGASTGYILKATAEDRRKSQEATAQLNREIDALKKLPPDRQAEVDKLDEKAAALSRESSEAQRAKNPELAKAKNEARIQANRDAYEIKNKYSNTVSPQINALYKKFEPLTALNKDLYFDVSLDGNGTVMASDQANERSLIGSNAKTNQATDRVVRITTGIQRPERATAAQLEIVKGLIDRARLQAIVAGKIPTLEDSNAIIARQNEAIARLSQQSTDRDKQIAAELRGADPGKPATNTQVEATSRPTSTESAGSTVATAEKPVADPGAPAKPAASAADTVNQAKDAVNKLRSLFGK